MYLEGLDREDDRNCRFCMAQFSSLSQNDADTNSIILYTSHAIEGALMKGQEQIILKLSDSAEDGGSSAEREGLMFGLEIAIMNARGVITKGFDFLFNMKTRLLSHQSKIHAFEKMKEHSMSARDK